LILLPPCVAVKHFWGRDVVYLNSVSKRLLGVIPAVLLLTSAGIGDDAEVPPALQPISGVTVTSPNETATKNVLALNTSMFELYSDAGSTSWITS
jgi:hypothetical protein